MNHVGGHVSGSSSPTLGARPVPLKSVAGVEDAALAHRRSRTQSPAGSTDGSGSVSPR